MACKALAVVAAATFALTLARARAAPCPQRRFAAESSSQQVGC